MPGFTVVDLVPWINRLGAVAGLVFATGTVHSELTPIERSALTIISGAIFIIDHFQAKKGAPVATAQTLTDLETAVTNLGTAAAAVEAAIAASGSDDATIESQVTILNQVTAALNAAAGVTTPAPTPPAA